MNGESLRELLVRQLNTLAVFLERPVVIRQVVALLITLVVAWILSQLVRRLVDRTLVSLMEQRESTRLSTLQKALPALAELYFPLVGLLLVQVVQWLFERAGFPAGILSTVLFLFWLALAYRLLTALLFLWLGEKRGHFLEWRLLFPLALWLLVALSDAVIDLSAIADMQLFTLSGTPVTFGRLLFSLFVLYLFLIGSSLLQDFLRTVVLPRTDADPGVVNTILAVSQYFIIILGIVAAMAAMGFSLSTLAVIGGGLSIGVGFGLQQVIANFVAGILLLFEQSLRPGDIVELNGEVGTVEKLSIRSTLVRTNDNVELIVPNETFLTNSVKTYTKSNRLVRITIDIGVSYDADPYQVRELLVDIANKCDLVRSSPAPAVLFNRFGESSLDFQLNVWVDDPTQRGSIASNLNFAIWETFKAHNIEIPFPQRDLHLRGGWEQLPPLQHGQ